MENVFGGLGVTVTLDHEDDFLKVKETLTRIGIASVKDKKLFQSCHILHKRGNYAIMHFKELFKLDGKPSNLSEEDIRRRNTIAILLQDWGLVQITQPIQPEEVAPINHIKILPYKEKSHWELVPKYNIGVRR